MYGLDVKFDIVFFFLETKACLFYSFCSLSWILRVTAFAVEYKAFGSSDSSQAPVPRATEIVLSLLILQFELDLQ